MNSDFGDFELIDRYLAGELEGDELENLEQRINSDETFRREVEVYRKLKAGIEQLEDGQLRERIAQYEEQYWSTPTTFFTPKRIAWISGVAASFLVVGSIFWFKGANDPIPIANLPGKDSINHHIDTIRHNHGIPDNKEPQLAEDDQSESQNNPSFSKNQRLAFGGQAKLASEQVKSFSYPQPLRYTFDGSTLNLIGDPLIPVLRLDVYLKQNQYFLHYKNQAYLLTLTDQPKALKSSAELLSFQDATMSNDLIKVHFVSLIESSEIDAELDVLITKTSLIPSFYYQNLDGELSLVIAGNFDPAEVSIYTVLQDAEEHRYAIIKGELYKLEGTPVVKESMKSVKLSKNDLSRLFRSREDSELRINILK